MNEIIGKIKEVCFSVNAEKRKISHRDLLERLSKMFTDGEYKVRLEYPIGFESIIRKSGDKVCRDGCVDLVAIKGGRKAAIEFDNGVHLKYKSIEKLFQVDAELCVGVVSGKLNALGSNTKRIEQVKRELRILKKSFWLIVLFDRIAYKL